MSLARRVGLALVLASAVFGAAGCKTKNSSAFQKEAFGEVSAAEGVDFAPYLATARAIVFHKDRPPAPEARAAQRVFLTVYAPHDAPIVTTALGDSLLAGVIAASEEAAKKAAGVAESARIKIDVASAVEADEIGEKVRFRPADTGVYGFLVRDAEHVGFVLPTEIVTGDYIDHGLDDGKIKIDRDKILNTVSARAGVDKDGASRMASYRFKTTAYVESTPPARALAVHRALLDRPATLGAPELLQAVRAGAEYLSRSLNERGRYQYMVHPIDEKPDRSYGILRHAGSTYALLEAYGEFHEPKYRARAETALNYMTPLYKATPDGTFLSDNADEEQQKVGGNGLALLALAKHMQTTGSKDNLELMRNLGRYMVHQQYPDGHFRDNADVMRENPPVGGKKLKKEVSYFAGEAVLGLLRLYQVDPQPQWLEAARKGAEFIVLIRDAHETEATQIHDHWGAYAINDLYREIHNPAYAEHGFKIARAILQGMKTEKTAPSPDFISTFYEQGETTPAATRLEALAADLELSRYMDKPTDWIQGPAVEVARYMRSEQFDEQNAFYLRNPDNYIGGVRESALNSDIRIDYVQHAMCAWLHLARVLRDPDYGKAGQGGVDAGAPLPAVDAGPALTATADAGAKK